MFAILNKRLKGKASEDYALNYLLEIGYILIERNSYLKHNEIDLIMQDGEFIVFVEVKSLKEDSPVTIYQTLTKTKKHRLKRAINSWLLKNSKLEDLWRFDFVGIVTDNYGALKNLEYFKFAALD